MRVAPPSPPLDRNALRRAIRARRRELSATEREKLTRAFADVARHEALIRPRMRIAMYVPYDGEADPGALIGLARRRGCTICWPVITHYGRGRMRFVADDERAAWTPNRYGIPEPQRRHIVPLAQIDLVIAPLVAVDDRGTRLGSGAGYYDRCMHKRLRLRRWRRPRFVGLAYEFQRVERLAAHPWDVPLDALITENALYRFPMEAAP